MNKKKILILIGIILFLIMVVLICYYLFRPIKSEVKFVPQTRVPLVIVPPSAFIEHINELPDGGGETKTYNPVAPVHPISEKEVPQEITPANTFIDHTAKFPGDIESNVYFPVPEVPVGTMVPPSTMIDNVGEFPQELE